MRNWARISVFLFRDVGEKKMKIPFFNLSRQYEEISEEVEKTVIEVMRSSAYIEGYAVKKLEADLCEYLGVKNVITCGNGTDALRIALQAVGVKAGNEVITTPFTFFATAEAISQTGATPVFVDIKKDSLNIDPELIREKITKRTKAILPVHIFGLPADMDEINAIGEEYGIPVIEDACQAIGASYKGKKTGNLGTIGCFSFYPTKNLGAFGDGGMITTNDDDLANICRALKSHAAGKTGAEACEILTGEKCIIQNNSTQEQTGLYDPYKYFNFMIGWNSRLDSIQAAVLDVKLKKVDEYNKKRNSIAKRYNDSFAELPIELQHVDESTSYSCFHQYPVLVNDRETFIKHMDENGIGTGAFYPVPLHLQKAYRKLGYKMGDLPISESICAKSVCLPIFPEMTEDEVQYVTDTVVRYCKVRSKDEH